jgi:hypothetical protein
LCYSLLVSFCWYNVFTVLKFSPFFAVICTSTVMKVLCHIILLHGVRGTSWGLRQAVVFVLPTG